MIKRGFLWPLGIGCLAVALAMAWSPYCPAADTGGGAAVVEAAHGAAPAVAGGHEGGVVELKLDLGLWTLLVFLGLMLVLRVFAWKPLMEALAAREKHLRESLQDTERAREEAKRLVVEHEHRLADVPNQVRAIVDEARRDAERMHQEILKSAQAEARAAADRAKREIDQARDHALQELFTRTVELSTAAAVKIVGRSLNPEDHRAMVKQAMAELTDRNG